MKDSNCFQLVITQEETESAFIQPQLKIYDLTTFSKHRGPAGERDCACKAPYKNNHIFIMSIFISCVLLGPRSFLQGQTKVS